MKLTLVVNPSASSVNPRTRVVIQRALSADHDVTAVETKRRGHATELARHAAADGADAVVVLSGDGTLNEVANGLVDTNTALATIPGGSTNVFARTIGMTNDPVEATAILLDALANNERQRISLCSANERYFLMNAGAGYDAAVVARVERNSWLKRYVAHPYFTLVAVLTWARSASPREDPYFTVTNAEGISISSYFTLCLNSNPYTYAGARPFDIAPGADFSKGMAVASVTNRGLPTMLGVLLMALSSGRNLSSHSRVDFSTEVQTLIVTNSEPFPYQLDGDYIEDVKSLTLRHHPQLLDVFMPL